MTEKKTPGTGKGRVKVKKLNVNKETVTELTEDQARAVKGGGVSTYPSCTYVQRCTQCGCGGVAIEQNIN